MALRLLSLMLFPDQATIFLKTSTLITTQPMINVKDILMRAGVQTLLCANVLPDQVVQVTRDQVGLLSLGRSQQVASWRPQGSHKINIASCSPSQASPSS